MVYLVKFLRFCAFVAIFVLIVLPEQSFACPVCFGAPADSPITMGMNMAILTMLGITGTILSMFVAFFLYLRKKANQ